MQDRIRTAFEALRAAFRLVFATDAVDTLIR